ncbi:shikimate kinase [bacterium]|nr:shikimate kinase [bacterium]
MSVATEREDAENPSSDPRNAAPPAVVLTRTVALIGLMGAGKSTIGRRLADALAAPFHDSDDEIEKAAGLSVQEIFDRHGEPEFRRGERRVIERLLNGPPCVLATGGGAYMDPQTRALMRERAVTIWLRADFEVLWRRVSRRDHRPLLRRPNPRAVLHELNETRSPVYATADAVIDSADGPHDDSVRAILDILKERDGR